MFQLYNAYNESNLLNTTVYGANAVMRAYDWKSNYRNVTFVNPTSVAVFTLDFESETGTVTGYRQSK